MLISQFQIPFPTKQSNHNLASRNYDSEDENMGRNRNRQQNQYGTRPPIYSKEDIIDQVTSLKYFYGAHAS
jgi:hypothetical protein